MKKFVFILMILALGFVMSCGGGDDEEKTSGTAFLKVINQSEYITKVFLDGTFIGNVEPSGIQAWKVSPGKHDEKFEKEKMSEADKPIETKGQIFTEDVYTVVEIYWPKVYSVPTIPTT